MYAAQASVTAESAVGARTSTSAMRESPSGDARMVAGPRTEKVQSAGATKVAPPTVCFGVSAVRCSGAEPVAAELVAAEPVAAVPGVTARLQDVRASTHAAARMAPLRRVRNGMGPPR